MIGGGAFQVYDGKTSSQMSTLLQEMLGLESAYVVGGDWRGIQYLVSGAEDLNDTQSTIHMFDASSMQLEALMDFGSFESAILSGDIVPAVDGPGFDEWCAANTCDGIPESHCVSPVRYAFLSGYDPRLDIKPIETFFYLRLAAKLRVLMQERGIEPGGPIPDDFFE